VYILYTIFIFCDTIIAENVYPCPDITALLSDAECMSFFGNEESHRHIIRWSGLDHMGGSPKHKTPPKSRKEQSMTKYSGIFESPFGPISILCSDSFILEISWLKERDISIPENRHSLVHNAIAQLSEYFSGKRNSFDLPLFIDDPMLLDDPVLITDPVFISDPEYKSFSGTPFQRKVWKALCDIPYGETETYGQLAGRIGCPGGARAVGSANAKNPVSIVIPCHRVIASGGRPGEISQKNLGGYSAFGSGPKSQRSLSLKQKLLELEIKNKQE